MKKIILTALLLSLHFGLSADSFDFKIKELKEFKTLDSFESLNKFESANTKYIKECMDNWGGSSAGVQCLIGYELWDRELNINYKKLYKLLDKKGKSLLKTSQKSWLKTRDLSSKLISYQADKEYTESGSAYRVMRASDSAYALTSTIKERALTLKKWLKLVKNEHGNEPESEWYKY